VWLHSGTTDKPGAARFRLYGPDRVTTGSVVLGAADRRDLAARRLLIRVYRKDQPRSTDTPFAFGE
jgi:hypothetical protein